jgi:Zn-dependent peptidase ImmA (M78 family)
MKIFEVTHKSNNNDLIKSFLPFAKEHLDIDQLPTIRIVDSVPGTDGTTFGRYDQDENIIYVVANGRHPKDAMRTLAHELVHYKQNIEDRLHDESGATGSEEENEANAQAGVIMRNFNQANPE